ncbi:MAG: zf-TFIIB domain-containing protein [Deltaproteobacteria bacterium]|nr:zf-TFIIB domain-containing protein [Deltaproteobacteria bacterium]MBW2497222.1 zf-TFIIB domain-containing protein [Deltaproteobacteria bacterium]
MQKEIAHMLVIDRCPTCGGVWLDGGELERLKGDVNEQALLAMSRGFGFG